MSASIMLSVHEVVAGYDAGPDILRGVSIHVKKGEIVSIIGPNGSGKSTLLRTIAGLLKPRIGTIIFDDRDITRSRPDKILVSGLSFIPQERSVFPKLTVKENLLMGGFTIKDKGELSNRLEEVLEFFPRLKERLDQKAGTMSGGEQRLLEMARALMLKPKMMMLDEPTLGLDPKNRKMIVDKVLELNSSGITFLIVEQNARTALKISNRAYVMELGRVRFEGTGEEILNSKEIQQSYLGRAAP